MPPRKRLGEILIQAGLLDNTGLHAALAEQRRWGGPLGSVLVEMRLVTEEALVQALSHQLNFPTVDLDSMQISGDVLALVPAELVERHNLVPFNREGKFLDVAMSDPTNLGVIDELRIRTQLNVRSYLAGPKMIERAMWRLYRVGPEGLKENLHKIHAIQDQVEESGVDREQEIAGLQERIAELEALVNSNMDRITDLENLVSRNGDVLGKVLTLLMEKGIATREEILERLR